MNSQILESRNIGTFILPLILLLENKKDPIMPVTKRIQGHPH